MLRLIVIGLTFFSSCAFAQIDLRTSLVSSRSGVVDIKHPGDGTDRLFLVGQRGEIWILEDGELLDEPFINVRELISVSGEERGLLSMAFSPDYASNGVFYLYFTDTEGSGVIASFRVSASNSDMADVSTESERIRVIQPLNNHNGGRLEFGPDGFLYLGLGDGGGGGDPDENGQNRSTLLGSIIRIDVENQDSGYSVPPDNPFVDDESTRSEIWALGVRNPWRISFDSSSGDLYVADVGQGRTEEVTILPAAQGGQNLGWNELEGNNCFVPNCVEPDDYLGPAFTYGRDGGACSVTGGEVYRGQLYPGLDGVYLFGDYCSGRIFGLTRGAAGANAEILLESNFSITTFGQDQVGNVYLADAVSGVYVLSDGPVVKGGRPMDGTMSGTYAADRLNDQGFFVNVGQRPNGTVFLFVAWFTFDNGNPVWVAGVGDIVDGASSVTIESVQLLSGLNFLEFSDDGAEREVVGSMVLTAASCSLMLVDYDLPGLGNVSGSLDAARLTNTAGYECE